jgi:hypothetical protein
MHDTAKLSDLADAEIAMLIAGGYEVTPNDVVRINSLAWNVEEPDTRLALSRGVPVEVGGVVLWPLTMKAYEWHRRVCGVMQTDWLSRTAAAYAMAHGYSEGSELEGGGVLAIPRVVAWGVMLRCRKNTLIEAMAQIIKQEETEEGITEESDTTISMGDLSANLSALTGRPAEEIEERMAMTHAIRILHYTMQAQEQTEGTGGKGAAYVRAEQSLGLYIQEIKERTDGQA